MFVFKGVPKRLTETPQNERNPYHQPRISSQPITCAPIIQAKSPHLLMFNTKFQNFDKVQGRYLVFVSTIKRCCWDILAISFILLYFEYTTLQYLPLHPASFWLSRLREGVVGFLVSLQFKKRKMKKRKIQRQSRILLITFILSLVGIVWCFPSSRQPSSINLYNNNGSSSSTFINKNKYYASSTKMRRIRRSDLSRLAAAKKKDSNDDTTTTFKLENSNVTFQLYSSIMDIPPDIWDECCVDTTNDGCSSSSPSSPFVLHSWLRCLEESKCASHETGWIPQHLQIKINGQIRGFVPLYIKAHSMGEFIFDNSWAEAASANGINYYPKLLVGVPFTPATGPRILLHPSIQDRLETAALRRIVALFLRQISASSDLSSVHMNFLTNQEAYDIAGSLEGGILLQNDENQDVKRKAKQMLKKMQYVDSCDYLRRTSLQYHWTNSNSKNGGNQYTSFDEYLSCFRSKRRIKIRRERRTVQEDEDIRIHPVVGKDILKVDGLLEKMFEIYMSTVNKMFWGRQYLSLEFFQLLAKSDFIDNLCFMCAAKRKSTTDGGEALQASDVIAGTFNVVTNGVFYGRYWGCLEEIKNLHFETCYWAAIEFCISNGIDHMEPGAGGGGKFF